MKSIKNMESEIEAMGGLEDGHQNRKNIEKHMGFFDFFTIAGEMVAFWAWSPKS